MKELLMTYHYQGKMDCSTTFSLPAGEMVAVTEILNQNDAVFRNYNVEVYDKSGNHISTARITWQLKKWEKTKVN